MTLFSFRVMKKEVGIIIVSLLFIFSFLFLKEGITGMYTFDTKEDICQYNTQCLLPKVCCKFYQEDSGICDYQDYCNGIYLATKQEKLQLTAGMPLTQEQIEEIAFEIEKPKKVKENSPLIIIGLILLILATMYLVDRMHKKKKN